MQSILKVSRVEGGFSPQPARNSTCEFLPLLIPPVADRGAFDFSLGEDAMFDVGRPQDERRGRHIHAFTLPSARHWENNG